MIAANGAGAQARDNAGPPLEGGDTLSRNPFDDESLLFQVLVDTETQYSLWPLFAEIPAGWSIVHGPANRRDCVEYVERVWTDMRPASVAADIGRSTAQA
ncbi:MbtH family protein [Nocardia sp. NPDC003963]